MKQTLTLALAKGRILNTALPLMAEVGVVPLEDPSKSRKLLIETSVAGIRLVVIRSADVPTYVEFGAADIGIVGKDVLMEYTGDALCELLDLGISRCRIAVAEPETLAKGDDPSSWRRLRIATKYPKITSEHFASKGIQTEIIKLYGSMELAPIAGLADRIVDLVDTGATLRANRLVEVEQIATVTARLVANQASLKVKGEVIKRLVGKLRSNLSQKADPE